MGRLLLSISNTSYLTAGHNHIMFIASYRSGQCACWSIQQQAKVLCFRGECIHAAVDERTISSLRRDMGAV